MVNKLKLVGGFFLQNKIIIVLFFVLFFVSVWRLQYSPATWYDEGLNAGIAKSLVEEGVYSLKVGNNEFVEERQFLITTNYPVILPVALSLKIFGNNLIAARIPMIFYLFLFAWAAYALTDKWFGKQSALYVLALIVVFLPFYGNGKSVLGEVAGLFYLLAGLYYLDSKKLWKLFLSGFFLGLSVATKPFFLIVLPALFVGEIYKIIKRNKRKPFEYTVLIMSGLVPILFWFWSINPNFTLNNAGSTLSYYSNSYADSTSVIYLVFSNIKRFFLETTPIHFMVMFVFSAWLILSLIRKKEVLSEQLVLISFVILNFLWYLKTPGWYRYFFPAHLILFLFFPAGLKNVFSKRITIIVIIFFVTVQSFMLVSKRNESLYYSSEAQDMAIYINSSINEDESVLVVNGPPVAFLLNGKNVEQYTRINSELVFAPKKLKENLDDLNNDYVVVGSLIENDSKLGSILEDRFEKIKLINHYTLYKNIK